MKQRWIFGILVTLIAAFILSCTGFFEVEEEGIIDLADEDTSSVETKILFDNSANNCAVEVFSSSTRGDRIAYVDARYSTSRSWVPTNEGGYPFYLTYYLQIRGTQVPYIPEGNNYGLAYVISPKIVKGGTTTIKIHNLAASEFKDEPLFNEAYLAVTNYHASAIYALKGTGVLIPVGEKSDQYVASGKTVLYKLSAGVNSNNSMSIMVQGRQSYLNDIPAFAKSNLYEISVGTTGSIAYGAPRLLTLNNLPN